MTSMAGLLVASAPRRRSLLARALRRSHGIGSPVARYRRACLNWQLNPTPGAWSECLRALLAVLEAHEMRSGGEERSG